MFVDAGTKWMDGSQLRQVLKKSGEWSIEYNPEYTKQTFKKKKEAELFDKLPGREEGAQDKGLMQHARHLSESPGWHMVDNIGVHVAHSAKSFRSPTPRFCLNEFPCRTTLAEFRTGKLPAWRVLEEGVDLKGLNNLTEILPNRARRLVSFFHKSFQSSPKAT